MDRDQTREKILSEYLKTASPEERRELLALLESRESCAGKALPRANSPFGPQAKQMAQKIQEQLGITTENIKQTAVSLVIQLAKQHKPNITDAELEALISEMVPGSGYARAAAKLPPEVLQTMVLHYITDLEGREPPSCGQGLPHGWQNKYWQVFPPEVKSLIESYTKGRITRKTFWREVKIITEIR